MRTLVCALLLMLAPCMAALAQPAPVALDDPDRVLALWLESSCLGEEAPALRAALRRHAVALRPALRRALDAGPPAPAVAAVRAAAAERHARRAQSRFDDVVVTGVSRDTLARLAREPARDFVADQVARYVQGYRANAIAGLGLIGAPDDRVRLRRLSGARDALALAARVALTDADNR